MSKKAKKIIILAVLLVIAAAGSIGYYLYNKGPRDIKDSNAIQVNAVALYNGYSKDSVAAGKLYTDKIVEVSGEVNEVSVNRDQKKIFTLKTKEPDAFINCTMEEDIKTVNKGDKINIKGLCSGIGSGDADLGLKGDVYLTRCYLLK